MRILILSNYYPPLEIGGWEQLTQEITLLLRQRGHRVQVLTSNYKAGQAPPGEVGVTRSLHLESTDYVQYHPSYTLIYPWREHQNRKTLELCVKDLKPDVLFVNGMWNLSTSIAWQAENLCPGRVVYYVASLWPTELDAHSKYWLDVNGDSWRQLFKSRASQILTKVTNFGSHRNQLDFAHVLCVSDFIRAQLVEEIGISPSLVSVVHNGIELSKFPVRSAFDDSTPVRLIYTGRLSFDKGVHTAVEALGLLHNEYRDFQLELTIVGSGAPDYEARLRRTIKDLGLSRIVKMFGFVSRDQIPNFLIKHDLFIFPSIAPDALARAVQEAMACGLPIIGTTTGGTPEILQDGYNGLTFKAGDAHMLADKIIQIAQNTELMVRMGRAGRKTVEDRFTLDRMVDQIEYHLESVLSQ